MHGHGSESAIHLSGVLVCVPVAAVLLLLCLRCCLVKSRLLFSVLLFFSVFSLSGWLFFLTLSRFGFVKVGQARKQQRTNQKGDAMMDHNKTG